MASSSKDKAKYSGPAVQDYLNGLQDEFDLLSNPITTKNLRPSRFNACLGGLKGEFKRMAQEIESLQKQSDEYKAKIEVQSKELQSNRRNLVCARCGGNSVNSRVITPQVKTPTTLRPSSSSQSSRPVSQLLSGSGRDVRSQQSTRRPTQPTPIIKKTPRNITPTKPSQVVSDAKPQLSDSSKLSACTVAPESQRNSSIIFDKEVAREIEIEMAHEIVHADTLWCVKFSQDGKYVAAGCRDGKAYIYDVQAGTLSCVLMNLLAKHDRITAVCFSRDGRYLATGLSNGYIYIWIINTKYVRNAFKGHTNTAVSLDFSPNDRLLLSASDDNTVRLWDMRHGTAKMLIEDNPMNLDDPCYRSAVFSLDGWYVAASHRDGIVRIWEIRTRKLVRRLEAHTEWVNDVAFMPDGKGLLGGSNDSTLKYWDTGNLYTPRSDAVEGQTREFLGHQDFVYTLSISPSGRWVASGSADQSVRIWDTTNGAMQCILDYGAWVYSVDFSPAGSHLASGEIDGALRIWRYSHSTEVVEDVRGS